MQTANIYAERVCVRAHGIIYIFVSSLLSLGLLIVLVAGTLPRLRRWEMKRQGREERKEKQRRKRQRGEGLAPDAYHWLPEI